MTAIGPKKMASQSPVRRRQRLRNPHKATLPVIDEDRQLCLTKVQQIPVIRKVSLPSRKSRKRSKKAENSKELSLVLAQCETMLAHVPRESRRSVLRALIDAMPQIIAERDQLVDSILDEDNFDDGVVPPDFEEYDFQLVEDSLLALSNEDLTLLCEQLRAMEESPQAFDIARTQCRAILDQVPPESRRFVSSIFLNLAFTKIAKGKPWVHLILDEDFYHDGVVPPHLAQYDFQLVESALLELTKDQQKRLSAQLSPNPRLPANIKPLLQGYYPY